MRREATFPNAAQNGAGVHVQTNLGDLPASPAVTTESSNPDKLALFKSLFRGREDVYAVRWTNPDGRAGYSTAALSRSHRERGDYLQLTDAVLRNHLDGHRTVGVYPLLQDDTCWFLAADFDKTQWQDDGRIQHLVLLHGGIGIKKRRETAEQLRSIPGGGSCAILATGRYAGEGFDHARLDTLLLALPISWRGTLRQYAGRIHREHPGKLAVRIYDYVDEQVPVLARMYARRKKGYLSMGYRIESGSVPVEPV